MQADICQLGHDQRKVNMLAREYCDLTKRKLKPIIVSHHMLPGLKEGQEKMSKSDPESAIFMEDSEADVRSKIKKAFCPPEVIEANPCIAYIRHIVLPWFGNFSVQRSDDNGGNKYGFLPGFACVAIAFRLGCERTGSTFYLFERMEINASGSTRAWRSLKGTMWLGNCTLVTLSQLW
jgi:hypothetical protein